jgi:hypothetical protein
MTELANMYRRNGCATEDADLFCFLRPNRGGFPKCEKWVPKLLQDCEGAPLRFIGAAGGAQNF